VVLEYERQLIPEPVTVINSVVLEYERQLLPEPVTEHDSEPILLAFHPHNLTSKIHFVFILP
jgi:hypothetical protein